VTDWEKIEHVWSPAMPGGNLCRYCGEDAEAAIHGLQLVQSEQAIALVILDHASDRGAMLTELVQVAERKLRRELTTQGLLPRGDVVLTINLRVEAS
jgi:hypothetical protein